MYIGQAKHPIFNGGTFGILTAESPEHPVHTQGGNPAMANTLKQMGLPFEPTTGKYTNPENSFVVHGASVDQLHDLAKKFGQTAFIHSEGGRHRMHYANGPNEGRWHEADEQNPMEHFEQPPPDMYTTVPGGHGHFRIAFNWDKLHGNDVAKSYSVEEAVAFLLKSTGNLVKNLPALPAPAAPALHSTVEGFMGGFKALPKDGPTRGKFITQHMNHGPFLSALSAHPQGKQIHAQLTGFLNSKVNAGPGKGVATVKSMLEKAWPRDEHENLANAAAHPVMEDALLERGGTKTVYGPYDAGTAISRAVGKQGLNVRARSVEAQVGVDEASTWEEGNANYELDVLRGHNARRNLQGLPGDPRLESQHGVRTPVEPHNTWEPGSAYPASPEAQRQAGQRPAKNANNGDRVNDHQFWAVTDVLSDPGVIEPAVVSNASQVPNATEMRTALNRSPIMKRNAIVKKSEPDLTANVTTLRLESQYRAHPHNYEWHDGHTAHHPIVDHAAPGLPGLAKAETELYPRFALPYGNVVPGAQNNLLHYDYAQKLPDVERLVHDHGFKVFYAGGKYGQADLANKNYNTGHLAIPDPTHEDGKHETYVRAWRQMHELAHALTLPELNKQYGEAPRAGALGQRSLHEALRSVHWEHLAALKQRELSAQIGVPLTDEQFNKEYNTVMHDSVHRAVTGQMTEPGAAGFVPHGRAVPLHHSLQMVRSAANEMGLNGLHQKLTKAWPKDESENLDNAKGFLNSPVAQDAFLETKPAATFEEAPEGHGMPLRGEDLGESPAVHPETLQGGWNTCRSCGEDWDMEDPTSTLCPACDTEINEWGDQNGRDADHSSHATATLEPSTSWGHQPFGHNPDDKNFDRKYWNQVRSFSDTLAAAGGDIKPTSAAQIPTQKKMVAAASRSPAFKHNVKNWKLTKAQAPHPDLLVTADALQEQGFSPTKGFATKQGLGTRLNSIPLATPEKGLPARRHGESFDPYISRVAWDMPEGGPDTADRIMETASSRYNNPTGNVPITSFGPREPGYMYNSKFVPSHDKPNDKKYWQRLGDEPAENPTLGIAAPDREAWARSPIMRAKLGKSELVKALPKTRKENAQNEAYHNSAMQVVEDQFLEQGGKKQVHGPNNPAAPLSDVHLSDYHRQKTAALERDGAMEALIDNQNQAYRIDAPPGKRRASISLTAGVGMEPHAVTPATAPNGDWFIDKAREKAYWNAVESEPAVAPGPDGQLQLQPSVYDTPVSNATKNILRSRSPVGKRAKLGKSDLMPGGKGDNKPDTDFNHEELAAGIRAEASEHGLDLARAKEVAKDHLTEDPKYYTKLRTMEKHDLQKGWTKGSVVYRVQNDRGEGPWDALGGEYMDTHFNDMNDVSPEDDFSPKGLDALQSGYPSPKFAFAHPDHAVEWFGQNGLNELKKLGFNLSPVQASRVWHSKSKKQLLYHPEDESVADVDQQIHEATPPPPPGSYPLNRPYPKAKTAAQSRSPVMRRMKKAVDSKSGPNKAK